MKQITLVKTILDTMITLGYDKFVMEDDCDFSFEGDGKDYASFWYRSDKAELIVFMIFKFDSYQYSVKDTISLNDFTEFTLGDNITKIMKNMGELKADFYTKNGADGILSIIRNNPGLILSEISEISSSPTDDLTKHHLRNLIESNKVLRSCDGEYFINTQNIAE